MHTAKGPQGTSAHKLVQANLQRKKLAMNELFVEAEKRGIKVALIQEPYVGSAKAIRGQRGIRVFQSTDIGEGIVKAAIIVFDNDINVIQYPKLTTNNITVVGIQTSAWEITLVSLYFEPDKPLEPYLEHLKKIEIANGQKPIILGGDINAKNTWWGSPTIDNRGEDVCGALGELGLHILNKGEIPTFDTIRGGQRYSSFVDITACSTNILGMVDDWKIDESLTSSDHNGITFNIKLQKTKGIKVERTTRLYNTKKANWQKFTEKFNQLTIEYNITIPEINDIKNPNEIDTLVNNYTKAIKIACESSMPTKKSNEKLNLPWWSEKLAKMKKEVTTKKRRIRCAAPVRRSKVIGDYLKQKEEYELEVAKAQTESWKEFCHKQDREGVWEGIYRVIGRTTCREEDLPMARDGEVLDAKGSVKYITETFYPEDLYDADDDYHRHIRLEAERVNTEEYSENADPPFTTSELLTASESFNPKKAPGADGLTADICSHAINGSPNTFLALLNQCLKIHYFPQPWKEATVVVLRKPGKTDYTTPKSYRPIGLLPILGKIYEKMLVARLKFYILPRMSTRQYGFMPQRSTEDSLYDLMQHIRSKLQQKKIVLVVSLDIEGAFDSAWWPAIRVRLAEEKCPVNLRRVMDSYLSERRVRVRYAGEEFVRGTTKGCVQGSIGGPILWNLLLDPLLKSLEKRGDYAQAFADDVILVFDGDTAGEIEQKANPTLERVRGWGVKNKLKFAPHKTNAMVITRKLKFDTPRLGMGGVDIRMTKEIKILGVTIDDGLTFNAHISNVCRKAISIHKQLCRAARVSWGLNPEVIKIIYVATIEPIILYAASVWAPAATKLGIIKQLGVVQRGIAQKMCKAYRTVSLNSALLIAGVLPLDLRIREAASLYEAKRGVPRPELRGGEVERVVSALKSPHPAERINLDFATLANREQLDASAEFDVKIFTDGSKIGGHVGAALSIWRGDAETRTTKLKLSDYCTVYQAELLALCRATEETLRHSASSFGIYSDSMAALQTVKNHSCLHPLAVEARDNLTTSSHQNKIINLFWIKAHAGFEGNERADKLAKEAAMNNKKRPDYDLCPVSYVRRYARTATLDEWNRRYVSGQTASVTKIFFPDAVMAFRLIRKMKIDHVITQILTGHGGFSEYLNRFKCKENPSCICDPQKIESVPHLITECPVYAAERYDIEAQIEENISLANLNKIMCSKNRDKFIEYCVKLCLRVINRNKDK